MMMMMMMMMMIFDEVIKIDEIIYTKFILPLYKI